MFPFIVEENYLILDALPLNPMLPRVDDFCCEVALGGTFSSLAGWLFGIGDFIVDEYVLLPVIPAEAVDPEVLLTFPFIDLLVPLSDTNGDRWGLLVPLYKLLVPFDEEATEVFEVWLLFSFESWLSLKASLVSCVNGCFEVTYWLLRWCAALLFSGDLSDEECLLLPKTYLLKFWKAIITTVTLSRDCR